MIKQWLIIGLVIIAGFGLLITGIIAVLAAIAKSRGVREMAITGDSLMAEKADGADYTDSFLVQVPLDLLANRAELLFHQINHTQLV